jgi:hypothetical protein
MLRREPDLESGHVELAELVEAGGGLHVGSLHVDVREVASTASRTHRATVATRD